MEVGRRQVASNWINGYGVRPSRYGYGMGMNYEYGMDGILFMCTWLFGFSAPPN